MGLKKSRYKLDSFRSDNILQSRHNQCTSLRLLLCKKFDQNNTKVRFLNKYNLGRKILGTNRTMVAMMLLPHPLM